MRRAVLAVILSLALVAAPMGRRESQASEPLILVYGDSLVFEATPFAEQLLRDVGHAEYRVVGRGGSATCDFQQRFELDAARLRPTVVVLAFSGNYLSPCMRTTSGELVDHDERLRRYADATVQAIITFRPGSPQIWLGTAPIPKWADEAGDRAVFELAAMWHEMAAQNPRVHVAESGAAVMHYGRHYAPSLPCLSSEPCQGGVDTWGRPSNFVRNQVDGTHFCPAPYDPLARCPVYASGAMRFAGALLIPVLRSMGRFDIRRASGTYWAAWPG